jgi:hypothetical protein
MLPLAIIGTLDTVLSHIDPNYRPAIITEILPEWWAWQVWLIAFLIVVLIATLHTASHKIRELTPPDIGINLVFNPARPDYKEVIGDIETYIIGISGRGGTIEHPEVFVHSLFKRTPQHINITVPKIRLTPKSSSLEVINAGITPTYFVNVLIHEVGQKEITFCHFDRHTKPTLLEVGDWRLVLVARGSNSTKEGVIRLLLNLDEQGNLSVSRDKELV